MKSINAGLKVKNNRKNGKRYEGELVKLLRGVGIAARLGRSNEEGDVILSSHNLIIECKSTSLNDRFRISKNPDQFWRLKAIQYLGTEVWYAIRYKGKGILGWRFFRIPERVCTLYRDEGFSLQEFLLLQEMRMGK
jgi:Holliday junction resolvase